MDIQKHLSLLTAALITLGVLAGILGFKARDLLLSIGCSSAGVHFAIEALNTGKDFMFIGTAICSLAAALFLFNGLRE